VSFRWTRAFNPVIAGTVVCTTDSNGVPEKPCRTVYNGLVVPKNDTNVYPDGTLSIYSRTDVNEDGTVTGTATLSGIETVL
jgi:hypothetical protein